MRIFYTFKIFVLPYCEFNSKYGDISIWNSQKMHIHYERKYLNNEYFFLTGANNIFIRTNIWVFLVHKKIFFSNEKIYVSGKL